MGTAHQTREKRASQRVPQEGLRSTSLRPNPPTIIQVHAKGAIRQDHTNRHRPRILRGISSAIHPLLLPVLRVRRPRLPTYCRDSRTHFDCPRYALHRPILKNRPLANLLNPDLGLDDLAKFLPKSHTTADLDPTPLLVKKKPPDKKH